MRISDWSSDVCSSDLLGDVAWVKDVAPSDGLRKWFGHDPAKWDGFRKRYFAELDANPDGVAALRKAMAPKGRNTLLFGTRAEEHHNAVALCEYLRAHRKRERKSTRLNSSHYCAYRMPSSA